jgi:hypothetical protein
MLLVSGLGEFRTMRREDRMYRPVGRVVVRRIGSDNLLVPISGMAAGEHVVFPVNETGLFIWERVSSGQTVNQTARDLSDTFELDVEESTQDCKDMVEQLMSQNLLECIPA